MAPSGPDPDLRSYRKAVAPHARRLRRRALADRLRASLFFLPILLVAAAVLAELAADWLDHRTVARRLPTFRLSPDVATSLLTTIAGATITTAGVVFSLLVVSLQLASGQFTPRVLRSFLRDRVGQGLIGLLLATFAFCVLALSQIDSRQANAPSITMTLVLLLAFGSVIAIVAYLNRISRQQYVGKIMERVVDETTDLIRELPYGPRLGERLGDGVPMPDLSELGEPFVVPAAASGWVQQISRRAVLGAVPPGSVVRLDTRTGAYLVKGEPFATIWPAPAPAIGARLAALLRGAVVVGDARTMQQDIDFGLRQLNDIGLRAMSRAVNDPTTGVEVVLRVASIMRPLVLATLPDQAVRDELGRVLCTPWDLDHGEYVRHAYSELRRYAAADPQVTGAMVRSLRMLRELPGCPPMAAAALDQQLELVLAGARAAGLLPEDYATVSALAGSSGGVEPGSGSVEGAPRTPPTGIAP